MPELSRVVVLSPDDFLAWWSKSWEVGQHVAIMGMNGSGKTTLEHFLLLPRKYILALDAKGYDSSLSAYGWPRTDKWPLPHSMRQAVKDGDPLRVIIGNPARSEKQWASNNVLMRRVLKDVFLQGRWTVLVDEGIIIAHRKFVDAGDTLDRLFITARDRGVSLVYGVQRPSIGRTSPAGLSAFSQSTWVAVSRTRDERVHDRVAEICGRPKAEMRGLIAALPKYCWAILGLDPHEPIRLVTPPKLKVVPKSNATHQSRLSALVWGGVA